MEVTGLCGTAVQRGTLTVNVPPTVSIVNPTNGTVFLAPATFPVIAEAQDTDGFITKVEFYAGLSNQVKISETTNVPPYFVLQTNLPVGTYRFLATATDNQGAMATSAPVNVTVISNLPLVVSGPIRLNYQTGFYEQTAHVLNPTPLLLSAVGVIVYNLPNDWRVQNASFVTNGLPGVWLISLCCPGGSADVTVKYFLGPNAHTNDIPGACGHRALPATSFSVAGTSMPISRN